MNGNKERYLDLLKHIAIEVGNIRTSLSNIQNYGNSMYAVIRQEPEDNQEGESNEKR